MAGCGVVTGPMGPVPTSPRQPAAPPKQLEPAAAALVRAALDGCDLVAAQRLGEAIGPGLFDVVRGPLVLVELAGRQEPWAAAGRALRYGGPVAILELEASLGRPAVDALVASGVLQPAPDGQLRSPFRLHAFAGTWVLADPNDAGPDAVMQPGPTTRELLDVVPADTAGPVLDVGTGPGSLALALAARGQGPVVAVDVNERACAFARFNASLNGLAVDVRAGDLLAPVQGERFALVVSQPPYVVLPDGIERVTFLHGSAGDERGARAGEGAVPATVIERLLAGLPGVLADGGVALVVADVPAPGEPGGDRTAKSSETSDDVAGVEETEPEVEPETDGGLALRWGEVIGTGADLLVLEAPGPTTEQQAIGYATVSGPDLGLSLGEAALRYRAHLAALGSRRAIRGLAVVRPGPAGQPVRALGVGVSELPVSWDALRLLLAAADLAGVDDSELADAQLAAWPGTSLAEVWAPGQRAEPTFELRGAPGGVAGTRVLNHASAVLFEVLATAGSVTLAGDRFAELCGLDAGALDGQVLAVAREGLREGVLVPHETLTWLGK